jgi:hypothetical protein
MSELKVKVLEAPIFEGVAQDLVLKSNNVNRIVIANTGPVSIQSNLSYSGTLTGNTGIIDIGSGQFYKDASGNVGIGTSTPIYKLHVSDSTAANSNTDIIGVTSNYFTNAKKSLTWFSGTDAVGRISTVYNTISGEVGIDMTFGSLYNLAVGMNNSELMRLTSGGRLGIGTPLPDSLLTVNGVASFAAGSAGFPSIARAGDLNTGIFFPAADTIAFSEGGAEVMRIDSAGSVGIGTSSPSQKLDVTGSILSSQSVTIGSSGLYQAGSLYSDANWGMILRAKQASPVAANFAFMNSAGTELMRIDPTGNVGIGTVSPQGRLDVAVNGSVTSSIRSTTAGSIASPRVMKLSFFGVAGDGITPQEKAFISAVDQTADTFSSFLSFGTNLSGTTAEKMRLDSSGNLLVGQTSWSFASNGTQIAANGRIYNTSNTDYNLELAGSTSARIRFYTSAGGNGTTVGSITVSGSATTYATSSDYRLKENVVPMTSALATVAALNPVTYNWKTDGSAGQGFIAHELQSVVPDCVTGEKDAVDDEGNPQYQGVDTSFLVATLVAAIQELTARLEVLENK